MIVSHRFTKNIVVDLNYTEPFCIFFLNIAITCQSEPYRKSSGKMACAIPINEKLTVKKAAEICQSKGAFLPFITTAREQRYLNHKRKKVFALSY